MRYHDNLTPDFREMRRCRRRRILGFLEHKVLKNCFTGRSGGMLLIGASLLFFLVLNPALHGAVYYVDFNGGNDANSGTSTNAPWKTLPGSCNAAGSGYLNSAWGSITSGSPVPAGSTIHLKSGAHYNGSVGGRVSISSKYYQPASVISPTTIERDTNWGAGSVVFDGTGMTIAVYRGMVEILMSGVVLNGVTKSGIIITNSQANGLLVTSTTGGTNGAVIENLEVGYVANAAVKIYSQQQSPLTNMLNITLNNVIAHDTTGSDSTYSAIWIEFVDGLMVSNCIAYNGGSGGGLTYDDGFHLGSVRNAWLLNCTAYRNGDQGFDFGRDGTYKTNDWGFNITARDCIAYSNYDNGFDFNSGCHGVVYINCATYETWNPSLGSPGFNVHQGTQGSNWWINCTSTMSSDRGWSFGWSGNPWKIPTNVVYPQFMINCISSGDSAISSVTSPGSAGGSLWVDSDSDDGCRSLWTVVNCVLGTAGINYGAVNYKGTIYDPGNVQNDTGGWFGTGCLTNVINWQTTNTIVTFSNILPVTNSVCLNAGAWVLTAKSSGSGTKLSVSSPYGVDVSRVFLPGDDIQIQGTGRATVAAVTSPNIITLTSAKTWSAGEGIWFPYNGTAPPIGAFVPLDPPSPPGFLHVMGSP
jgi:hypothetical protein